MSTAVGGDLVYDDRPGRKGLGTDLVNRYMDRVIKAGQHDDEIVIRLKRGAGTPTRSPRRS